MPEIIENLTLSLAKCPAFTVNNAVDFVTAVLPGGPQKLFNPGLNKNFLKGDSFRILSLGLVFPESFTLWKDPALSDEALAYLLVAPFGVTANELYFYPNLPGGFFYLPFENYETITDVFFDCRLAINSVNPVRTLLNENFYLQCFFGVTALQVSMQGVPAAMNAKVFQLVPFVKIVHNVNLVP
jgi:hypothetical protein